MTTEQDVLRDTVRQLLARSTDTRAAMTSTAGYDEKLWAQLGALGLTGLAYPPSCEATYVETAVVLAELGRSLTPGPFLGAVVAAAAIESTGSDRAGLLPLIASGDVLASLVWGPYALDAESADMFLAVVDDGLYVLEPAEVTVTPAGAMDPTRRLATVTPNVDGRFLGTVDLDRLRAVACMALAAESAGAAARCLELTVTYAGQRVQFGRPIGSFQALKHRMADMHVLVETAESAALAAASDLDAAVTARVWCTEAYFEVSAEMIQLHGGIAITWEHDAHLYLKRANGNLALFGPTREHLGRLGADL